MRAGESVIIGVLALQGGFSEHKSHLNKSALKLNLKIEVREVRTENDLDGLDGLVIPGGESTSMRILLGENDALLEGLKEFSNSKPVFGTCAGMILLANEVIDGAGNNCQIMIGGLDIQVIRNYYGSQKQSFEAYVSCENNEELEGTCRMLFIRAPGVVPWKEGQGGVAVEVLAKLKDSIVAVRQNNLIATAFHPELTPDLTWHIYFLKIVQEFKENQIKCVKTCTQL